MSINSIQNIYFTVTLTNFGASSEGFVDNDKAETYIAAGATKPTTMNQTKTKARGNIRWDMLVQMLTENSSPIFLGNIVKTGSPDVLTAPATIQFQVGYDREETIVS